MTELSMATAGANKLPPALLQLCDYFAYLHDAQVYAVIRDTADRRSRLRYMLLIASRRRYGGPSRTCGCSATEVGRGTCLFARFRFRLLCVSSGRANYYL